MSATGRARSGFVRFIGVDLGGGRGKTTAIARLEHTEQPSGWRLVLADAKARYGQRGTGSRDEEPPDGDTLFRDDVLAEYLLRWTDDATVVAIDAPLAMPPCLRCTLPCPGVARCEVDEVVWMRDWAPALRVRGRSDPGKPLVTPYTQRATELLLAGAGLPTREAMGQGTGPLAARAAHLRRRMSPRLRLHENLIEVSPGASLVQLFGATRARRAHHGEQSAVWDERKRMLAALAHELAFDYVWPELVVRNAHVFAAVMCAFTAYLWAAGRVVEPVFDDAPSGLVPPVDQRDGVQRAGLALGDAWISGGWVTVPRAVPTNLR
jgi:predicted nuclease with RNAse H fold